MCEMKWLQIAVPISLTQSASPAQENIEVLLLMTEKEIKINCLYSLFYQRIKNKLEHYEFLCGLQNCPGGSVVNSTGKSTKEVLSDLHNHLKPT